MARIVEIHETHVLVNENEQIYSVPIDLIKFEPRLNDYVSLVKNEDGAIINIFLEKEPTIRPPFIIVETEQPKNQLINEQALNKAKKIVGIYSLIFGLIGSFAIFSVLKNPILFEETFIDAGLEIDNLMQSFTASIVITSLITLIGILLLFIKNRKIQYIFTMILFIVYSMFLGTALLFFLIDPTLALLQAAMFITPFIYSLSFLKNYKIIRKQPKQ